MARGTPAYNTGSITGTNNVQDLMSALETELKAYQSNAQDAWEELQVLDATAGQRDVVFRSRGDRTLVSGAGDAHLIARLAQVTATVLEFRAYQDWSTNDSAGARESTTTQLRWNSVSATEDIDWFRVSNEYEFVFVAVQGGDEYWVSFGNPIRRHVPPSHRGIAKVSSAATSTGSNVVISIDRDISSLIKVGAWVWAYNITADGNVLESATIQLLPVVAVTASTITLNITADLVVGSLIGMDPSFMHITSGLNVSDGVGYAPNTGAGLYVGAAQNSLDYTHLGRLVVEGGVDPNPNDLYAGGRAMLVSLAGAEQSFRGISQIFGWAAQGAQASNLTDRMEDNYDAAARWKYFPGLLDTGWGLMIGPGV
jgi:hypothetical protein